MPTPQTLGTRVALHLLSRAGHGPRPGDIDRVLQQGPTRWIEEQLSPGPDPELETRLSSRAACSSRTATSAPAWASSPERGGRERKDDAVTLDRPSWRLAAGLAVLAVVVSAAPARAVDRLPADLFAGYAFAQIEDVNRHGVNLASGFHLFGRVSGFVDASARWGSQGSLGRSDLTLMAGPGVRFGKPGGLVFFVRGLAGLVTDRASTAVVDGNISESDSRFGVMAGGGIDIPFALRWALRAQGDWLWNDLPEGIATLPPGGGGYSGPKESGFRASAGVVYRFGSRP